MKRNPKTVLTTLVFLLLISAVLALISGSVSVPFKDLLSTQYRQIFYSRLMRLLLALFTGAGLSIGGVALQALLRNPLAEPYLLGTSSGAGLGAVAGIALGLSAAWTPFTAFAGALASIALVYFLSQQGATIPIHSLILSGVMVGMWFSAIMVFLASVCTNQALQSVVWYLMGSLQLYEVRLLITVGIIVLSGSTALYFFSQDLNAISIGEEEALHVGVEIERVKKIVFLLTAGITGALVAGSGMIGFVGLIVPHLMRFMVGPNHKVLFPSAALAGGIFLIVCDVLSRCLFPPIEIPIGVITAFIGVPLFMVILKRSHKGRT